VRSPKKLNVDLCQKVPLSSAAPRPENSALFGRITQSIIILCVLIYSKKPIASLRITILTDRDEVVQFYELVISSFPALISTGEHVNT
jgi:hypothetical protein